MKFNKGIVGKTRTSELALLTSCAPSEGFEKDSRDVNINKALLALRRFPIRRYGNTARDAKMAAVRGSSFVYHSYSSFANVSADSNVPRTRCFSASYGSFSEYQSQYRHLPFQALLRQQASHTFGIHRSNGMV